MQCKFFTILDTRTAILSKGSVSLRLCVVPTSVFTYRRAAYSITKPEGEERVGCDGETVSSAQKEREREMEEAARRGRSYSLMRRHRTM